MFVHKIPKWADPRTKICNYVVIFQQHVGCSLYISQFLAVIKSSHVQTSFKSHRGIIRSSLLHVLKKVRIWWHKPNRIKPLLKFERGLNTESSKNNRKKYHCNLKRSYYKKYFSIGCILHYLTGYSEKYFGVHYVKKFVRKLTFAAFVWLVVVMCVARYDTIAVLFYPFLI